MAHIICKKGTIKKLILTSSILNIKGSNLAIVIEDLCDTALELNKTIKKKIQSSKNYSLNDLFKQLYALENRTTKEERIMSFIFKESINNHTIFLKLIKKRLSLLKLCTTQEALNIIRKLETKGFILKTKKCPKCDTEFNFLPNKCEKCGYDFNLKHYTFKNKCSRPRFIIEITKMGKDFVDHLIENHFYIYNFFQVLQRYKYSKYAYKSF